ncbi:MAG TPA: hypothetical protein PLP33_29250 [Leptospiraceae bacterium]|nr:hypothetical protein [Leptospiraceae bacterium]
MNLDKAKNYARKLWHRLQSGLAGGTEAELDTAKKLFEDIKSKYGWTNEDLVGVSSNKDENIRLEFVPEISYKSNPKWFKILIQLVSSHFECKAVAFYDRLGAALLGTAENTENFRKELEFAIDRSKKTYKVVAAYLNDLNRPDYFFGFAVGFNQALIQEKLSKQQENLTDEEKELTNKLVKISMALVNAEKEVTEMKGKVGGKTKDEDLKQEIKDENSFLIGYTDGKLAKTKLIQKGATK